MENGAIVSLAKRRQARIWAGLVNDPAFKNLPLWAKNGEQLATPESGDNAAKKETKMTTEEIDALRSKCEEQKKEIDALKASGADNQRLSQSQVELKNIELEIENAEIKARSESLQKEVTATNKRGCRGFAVKAAIQRGAILPKDTKTQTELDSRAATSDPSLPIRLSPLYAGGADEINRNTNHGSSARLSCKTRIRRRSLAR